MTYPLGGARPARPAYEPDPLTDSAVHRLGLGTQVRLWLYGGVSVDVGLLAIRNVSTWDDLAERIVAGQAIEVKASRRRVFGGGAVMWAEVLTDPLEDAPVGTFDTVAKRHNQS
jgi:hypothetical protein